MAECKKCIHEVVCESAKACDGRVPGCKHFKEQKKGRWIAGVCSMCGYPIPTDSSYDFIDKDDCLFCYHCGADMRG